MTCITCEIAVTVTGAVSITPAPFTMSITEGTGADTIAVSSTVKDFTGDLTASEFVVKNSAGEVVTDVVLSVESGTLTATATDAAAGAYTVEMKVCDEANTTTTPPPVDDESRPLAVKPSFPSAKQDNAYALKFAANGSTTWANAPMFTLSHEPKKASATVVETKAELEAAMLKRPALIQVKGSAMAAQALSQPQAAHDGVADGVTVIESHADGGILPSVSIQDNGGFFFRNFHSQPPSWKLSTNGICDSVYVSGIRLSGPAEKTIISFNPPLKSRGKMTNCWAQDIYSVYDEDEYDQVMVTFGTSDFGYSGYIEGHAEDCGTINVAGLNWGDVVQAIAFNDTSLSNKPHTAWVDMVNCRFIATLGVATFSSGVGGGNNSPENVEDYKCKSSNKDKPLQSVGCVGVGFGPSESDQGIVGVFHVTPGHLVMSNGLSIASAGGFASSSYGDHGDSYLTNCHVCGDLDYAPWRAIVNDRYVNDGSPYAYTNYADVSGATLANLEDNTSVDHVNPASGTNLTGGQTTTHSFTLPAMFAGDDSRLATSFNIKLPTGAKELSW